MKNILNSLVAIGMVLSTGCDYSHETRAQKKVQELFPDAQVVRLPSPFNHFIARDRAGNIWYAECDYSIKVNVTGVALMIKGDGRAELK